jgi:hypothetical protein
MMLRFFEDRIQEKDLQSAQWITIQDVCSSIVNNQLGLKSTTADL